MTSWKDLLGEENLSDEQLKSIPTLSCEQIYPLIEYANRLGVIPYNQYLEGMSVGLEHFQNPHN